MDKLYKQKIDNIDAKIINLFERRMSFVKSAAEFKRKHDIRLEKKSRISDIVDKVTSLSCDTEVIEYTEGLMMYLHGVSIKYQRKIINAKRRKSGH